MRSPKWIILVISSTLLASVKKKVPTRFESGAAPPGPLVPLPGFAQVTWREERPLNRQRVFLSAWQEPEAPAVAPNAGSAATTALPESPAFGSVAPPGKAA